MDLREAILPTGAIVHPYLDASSPLFHALSSLREITDVASTAGAVSELLQAAGSACDILRPILVAPGIHGQAAKAVAPRWRERHAAACCLVGRAELALGLRGCTTRALHAVGECCPPICGLEPTHRQGVAGVLPRAHINPPANICTHQNVPCCSNPHTTATHIHRFPSHRRKPPHVPTSATRLHLSMSSPMTTHIPTVR